MTFISTAGHGYLKVTINQLKKAMLKGFKPTSFSFYNKTNALLEEDCDLVNFLKSYFGEEKYKEEWKKIKDIYQNDINRTSYKRTPDTLSELDKGLNILSLNIDFIGRTMITTYGETYTISSIQNRWTKGYIYKSEEGNYFVMKPTLVEDIK